MKNIEKLDSLARKVSSLYDESLDEEESSPILSELKSLNQRYTQKEEIARGGMKSINKVFDVSTSRYLAMAELLPEIDEDFNEVFLREARLTALLEHPNIISIHDIGLNEGNKPYFTMDLKTGDTLEDILRELKAGNIKYIQQYTLHSLLAIFIKICDAVAYAHSRNVIHLDLKPANIQVGNYGEVLVCDWGLGKIIGDYDTEDLEELLLDKDLLNNMTFNGEIKGTPGFMAPEQVEPDGEKDKITDIYSLGCILYSLLTYQKPLSGNLEDILKRTLSGDIKPPNSFFSDIPSSLSAVTMHAMAGKKADRYQSVNELKKEVLKFQSGYSTHAENAGVMKELSLFIQRNRTICLVIFLAMVIITFMAAYFINHLSSQTKVALNAKKIAENHQKRAAFVAEQYKKERNESQKLMENLNDQYWEEVQLMSNTFVYQQPVKSLNKAVNNLKKSIELNPEKAEYKTQLAYLYFTMQRFEEVNNMFDPEDLKNDDLYAVSKKYVGKLKENGLLSIKSLASLILEFKQGVRRNHLIEKMLAYDADKRIDDSNYAPVVKAILKAWNPDWDMTNFTYKPDQRRLEISHPEVKTFTYRPVRSSNLCILRFLKFNTLILSRSGIYDIDQIDDLKNQFLDIRYTKIDSLKGIEKLTQLKYFWISKNQFSEKELKHVPVDVKVVYK